MADFTFNPSADPARRKAAALQGAPGTLDYPAQVAAYNQWLYTPMDRRPTPPTPVQPLLQPLSSGYNGPTVGAPVQPGSYTTPYGTASVSNPTFNQYTYTPPTRQPLSPAAPTGAAGPTGDQGQSIIDTAPRATFTPGPPQNSMQRWQASSQPQQDQGGMRQLSDQRRYFWATNHIDASTHYANPSQNKGAVAPVTFVNSPSQWTAW